MQFTIKKINEIVEETKYLSRDEQIKVALSMPITACAIYVLTMKNKYGIDVPI